MKWDSGSSTNSKALVCFLWRLGRRPVGLRGQQGFQGPLP